MPAARALEVMLEIHGAPVRRGMTSPLSALFHDIEAARRRERER
jgi:hypothetical protein